MLAAAVRAGASLLVTFNLRDFAAKSTDPYEVDVVDPDDFLLDLLDLAPVPCSTSWPDRRPRISLSTAASWFCEFEGEIGVGGLLGTLECCRRARVSESHVALTPTAAPIQRKVSEKVIGYADRR